MQVLVSPPGFGDWDALLALLRESFAYMDSRIDPPSSLHRMGTAELRAKARVETLIVALDGTRLIGCAFVALRADCAYVGKLAVAADARGRGHARAILAAAERVARDNGRGFVELQTRVELTENHRTFQALGFVEVGKTAHAGYLEPTSITMRKPVAFPAT